jgi:surfactin synthase thioesterase subunit
MSKLKLFCFPYAGGSSAIFTNWKQFIDPSIQLIPIELSGRGKRIQEPLYKDVQEMITDAFSIVRKELNNEPFSFFGHSMGGMISYQLGQYFKEKSLPTPKHIFFSGRSAPHVDRPDEKKYHLMDEKNFKQEVINLGGTPAEFFDHPELVELFLPLLKNDFKLAETNINKGEIHPLDCNITVFLGKDEDLTTDQCDGWKKHTSKLCSIHYFEGGHFFLHNETEQIVRLINNTLLSGTYV